MAMKKKQIKQDFYPRTCDCKVQRDADIGLMRMDIINFCKLHGSAKRMKEFIERCLKDNTLGYANKEEAQDILKEIDGK